METFEKARGTRLHHPGAPLRPSVRLTAQVTRIYIQVPAVAGLPERILSRHALTVKEMGQASATAEACLSVYKQLLIHR